MIPGYVEQTQKLSEKELKALPFVIEYLQDKKGSDNLVALWQIQNYLGARLITMPPSRVRKIINHIRINNLLPGLISNNKGYWVETDKNIIKKYVQSLLIRADAIKNVAIKLGNSCL